MNSSPRRFGRRVAFVGGLAAISLAFGGSVASATDTDFEGPVEAAISNDGEVVLQPGTYYEEDSIERELAELGFASLDGAPDRTDPGQDVSPIGPGTCVGCYFGSYETKSNGTRTKVTKAFVRHLTPAWAKANSYSWGSAVTISSSLSASIGPSAGAVAGAIGVSASVTRTWSVAVSIPASKTRFSKLSLRSDFYSSPVKSRLVQKAALRPTLYGPWKHATHMAPIAGGQYLVVTYQ